MKSRLSFIAVAVVTCLLIATVSFAAKGKRRRRNDTQPTTTTAPATQAAAAKPVNKFCAVEQDNPVDPKVPTIVYNGQVIGFCCEDCAPTFKKNPEKYLKTMK